MYGFIARGDTNKIGHRLTCRGRESRRSSAEPMQSSRAKKRSQKFDCPSTCVGTQADGILEACTS